MSEVSTIRCVTALAAFNFSHQKSVRQTASHTKCLRQRLKTAVKSQSETLSSSDSSLITAPGQWRPDLGEPRRLELPFKLDTLRIPVAPEAPLIRIPKTFRGDGPWSAVNSRSGAQRLGDCLPACMPASER